MKKILVDSMITLHKGLTPDEGKPINAEIRNYILRKERFELDFSGVEFMTTAFLNVVIGDLYKDYTSEQLKEYLTLSNIDSRNASRIKMVTDTAKLFYKDQILFNKNVEEAINDKY